MVKYRVSIIHYRGRPKQATLIHLRGEVVTKAAGTSRLASMARNSAFMKNRFPPGTPMAVPCGGSPSPTIGTRTGSRRFIFKRTRNNLCPSDRAGTDRLVSIRTVIFIIDSRTDSIPPGPPTPQKTAPIRENIPPSA